MAVIDDGVVASRNLGLEFDQGHQADGLITLKLGDGLWRDRDGRIHVAFRPRWRWLDVCLVVIVVAATFFVGWAIGEWATRPVEVLAWLASIVFVWLTAWWISVRLSWMYDPHHPRE